MAAAWARAKRALATCLCVSFPARQRAIEDAPPPPAVEAPSSVSEDKLESASVSVRRLTSFGSRSSQQVGISSLFSFFFLCLFFSIRVACRMPEFVCMENWRCGRNVCFGVGFRPDFGRVKFGAKKTAVLVWCWSKIPR
jgi:hypothetical protein